MNLYKLRFILWMIGLICCCLIVAFQIIEWKLGVVIGFIILFIDFIVIGLKNRCPFCNKALPIKPKQNEFCRSCGCEID